MHSNVAGHNSAAGALYLNASDFCTRRHIGRHSPAATDTVTEAGIKRSLAYRRAGKGVPMRLPVSALQGP
jgi:hypothetical protein